MIMSCISVIISAFTIVTIYMSSTKCDEPATGGYFGQVPPGDRPVLFAPGIISTEDANIHSAITFTPDCKEAYFARLAKNPGSRANGTILVVRMVDSIWQQPVPLKEIGDAFSPMLSPDGNRLIFAADDRLKMITRTGGNWSNPVDLGDLINFQKRQDGACLSADSVLYFTSMFGSTNGIFCSRMTDGALKSPDRINTGYDGRPWDGYPYVSSDGSYMIFMSWRPRGYGNWDLYVMFRTDSNEWSEAINLGPGINSAASESFPSVSPDGQYLYFNSNRRSQLSSMEPGHFYGNIYWVKAGLIKRLKPTEAKQK
jgi:hypothetical protein